MVGKSFWFSFIPDFWIGAPENPKIFFLFFFFSAKVLLMPLYNVSVKIMAIPYYYLISVCLIFKTDDNDFVTLLLLIKCL